MTALVLLLVLSFLALLFAVCACSIQDVCEHYECYLHYHWKHFIWHGNDNAS